jgi:hypothetical protein
MIKIKINSKSKKKLAYCQLHIAYYSRLLLTAFWLLAFSTEINPTIRYVSPTGSNIPPYLTWEDAANVIQDAINICEPGDTVLVDNGTYFENLVINTPISLIGLSMDSTIIDGRNIGNISVYVSQPSGGGSIENFTITGYGASILTEKKVLVRNCRLTEGQYGISISGTSSIAENLIIENISIGSYSSCIADTCETYILNSLFILDNFDSRGIQTGIGGELHITNNIMLFTGTSSFNHGISVGAPKNVYIYNNLISGFGHSIYFDTITDTAYIKNNVFSYGGSLISLGNRIYTNNIVLFKNVIGLRHLGAGGFVRSDYNLFWQNGIDLDGTSYGDSDRVANPMFVKDTLPNPQLDFDYRLQAYSPSIDAGNPDILDVDGSRSDIGMYGGPLGQTYKYLDLPPATPVNASAVIYQQNQILLRWLRNSEADTSHYNVYRDTVTNFAIDSTKLIASITDTFYVEPIPPGVNMLVYKITAVDQQGNQSLPTPDRIVMIVGVDEYEVVPLDYELYQNYPNPFNPSTKIGYNLKERGYVKLMLYDITGSLVSVLVNKEQESGYYEVEFNVGNGLQSVPNNLASGIYLYRIEVIGEGRIPKFSDMKKMVFIK